jgi:hypothetical protein
MAVLLGAAFLIRSAALFLIPVAILALVLACPRPWLPRWRPPAAVAAIAALTLVGYAAANQATSGRFEIGPASGWHLYGRAASFADCARFTPPAGTEALCESNAADQRPGLDFYLYDGGSPAWRVFGERPWEHHDSQLGAFGRAAVLAQPGSFAKAVYTDLKAYFVPTPTAHRQGTGGDLDPQLDWGIDLVFYRATHEQVEKGIEQFYAPYRTAISQSGRSFLHDLQRKLRFGATLLALCTLLTLLGLVFGGRRARVGVLLFGVGALAMLAGNTLLAYYLGRYSVPLAGPLTAAASIAGWSLWTMERDRRRTS